MLDAKPLSPRITNEEAQKVAEAFLEYKNVLKSVSTKGKMDPVSKYFFDLEQRPPIEIGAGIAYHVLLGDINKRNTLPEIKTEKPSSFVIVRTSSTFEANEKAPFAKPFEVLISTDELLAMSIDDLWAHAHPTAYSDSSV